MRATRQLAMSKQAVGAEAFRVARPALRALKAQGMQLQRIQPADPQALLKPWHANLPVGSMGPGVSNVKGNTVQIAKGKLRTPEMSGGTNYPLSTLAHEAGHWQHDKVHGMFQPRTGRPLPEQHPMRFIETPVRELQANNTANQMLQRYGASPQAQQWYNNTRADSFKSHLVSNYHRMAALPAEVRAAPDFQKYRDAWSQVASQPFGHTPTFSVKNDLPAVRQMTSGFTAGNTKMATHMKSQRRLQLADQMRKQMTTHIAVMNKEAILRDFYKRAQELNKLGRGTDEKPGLWANIRAKKQRGEATATPGDKDYPDAKNWNKVTAISEKEASAAWQRSEGKNPAGGLNAKGVASYRAENPGSKLQMAVTTEPSKLDPDSKPAKRRKSFCARMSGMPGPMKDEKGKPTRKALALSKWNC